MNHNKKKNHKKNRVYLSYVMHGDEFVLKCNGHPVAAWHVGEKYTKFLDFYIEDEDNLELWASDVCEVLKTSEFVTDAYWHWDGGIEVIIENERGEIARIFKDINQLTTHLCGTAED